jgi:Ca-activated chloride channel family protein
MSPRAVPATDSNLRDAADFVRGLNAGGGTEMLSGVREALARSPDAERRRLVALLTDGFIGNEDQVIAEVADKRGATRFFSFGVGSSPNRHLIEGVARMGGGAMAYVGLRDDADKVMRQYLERVSHPALTDVSIDFGGMNVASVYPRRLPDLFVGRPVIITGRCTGTATRPITVTGRAGGQLLSFPVATVADADADAAPPTDFAAARALPALWARMFIADLSDQMLLAADPHRELEQQIKLTALEYGLMSPYTAFIAVDSTARTAGDHGTTVPVPVPVPEGTRYDTTVQE